MHENINMYNLLKWIDPEPPACWASRLLDHCIHTYVHMRFLKNSHPRIATRPYSFKLIFVQFTPIHNCLKNPSTIRKHVGVSKWILKSQLFKISFYLVIGISSFKNILKPNRETVLCLDLTKFLSLIGFPCSEVI